MRDPPAGQTSFKFDFDGEFPTAMVMLQEDPNLEKMRFTMVPKEYVYTAFLLFVWVTNCFTRNVEQRQYILGRPYKQSSSPISLFDTL